MAKIGPKYESSRFTYIKEEICFVVEVSTLDPEPFGRLYDDACDWGFWMKSCKTGETIPFMHTDTKRDEEGDLISWEFESWGDKEHQRGIKAFIYND